MIERAGSVLDTEQKAKLRNLVFGLVDIWRVAFSRDGPANLMPLKVHIKHDSVPQQVWSRRYAVDHRNWMLKNVKALGKMGFVYRKKNSWWSSPVMIVPKSKQEVEFCMVIECRYSNSQVQQIWKELLGLAVWMLLEDFGSFLWSLNAKKFTFFWLTMEFILWQKLIQGSTDSAHAFQAGMMEVLDGMMHVPVLIWIDDVLLFAKTFEDFFRSWKNLSSACGNSMSSWILTRQIYVPVKSRGVEGRYLKLELDSMIAVSKHCCTFLNEPQLINCRNLSVLRIW